ncbi:MAG: hypothetical protein K2Q20_06985 [Phycisphaerales bacterium]|nr:hypothetical protein [Phycisphaerales bacterium]
MFDGTVPTPGPSGTGRRRVALHVVLLALLAAVAFLPGLDTFGVYGWQEGQRLLVAQQMDARLRAASTLREVAEALVVPRVNGLAYVAKPPMIYWAQVLAARATGRPLELWHLRLVIALAGALGVLATYWAGREILGADGRAFGLDGVPVDDRLRDSAAFWGAAMAGTGLLYVRSGRVGELDIVLTLMCTLAIGAAAWSWASWRRCGRAGATSVALNAIATTAAAMCKDPAVMIIALGGYAGILLHAAVQAGRRCTNGWVERLVPFAVGIVAAAVSARTVEDWADWGGVVLIGLMCGSLAWVVVRLADPLRLRGALAALHGVRAWLVLGLGVAASIGWRLAIARLIGPDEAGGLLSQEIDDNLRPLVAGAAVNNLRACAFAVGAGSVMAAFGVLWFAKDRPRLPAGWWVLAAWIGLNLCAFSLLGKGVQRYLTPVWPAVGLLGGLALASLLAARRARGERPLPAWIVGAVVVALALGQGWHYAVGRERMHAALSPRDLARELASMPGLDVGRLHSFEFASPGLESYLGRRVTPVGELRVNIGMSGGPAITLDELAARVREGGPIMMLIATSDRDDGRPGSAVDRVRDAGFVLSQRPTVAVFRHSGRSTVGLFEVSLANGSAPGNPRP